MLASLHNHTGSDPIDPIPYSEEDFIDHAAKDGFKIVAITCHNKHVVTKKLIKYAKEKGILLIPGIEKSIKRRHIVILNSTRESEDIKTFADLKKYKENHPECFIFPAHPYFPSLNIFKDEIEPNIDCFDGIELSWWYSKLINFNKKGEKLAKKYDLPFIGTSDTHFLHLHGKTYCQIDAKELSTKSVLEALRKGDFKNITKPIPIWRMTLIPFIILKDKAWLLKKSLIRLIRGKK